MFHLFSERDTGVWLFFFFAFFSCWVCLRFMCIMHSVHVDEKPLTERLMSQYTSNCINDANVISKFFPFFLAHRLIFTDRKHFISVRIYSFTKVLFPRWIHHLPYGKVINCRKLYNFHSIRSKKAKLFRDYFICVWIWWIKLDISMFGNPCQWTNNWIIGL